MLAKLYLPIITAGSSSGSQGPGKGGGREIMKSMQPTFGSHLSFMTYFHRARGGHGPLAPPRNTVYCVLTVN